MPVLDDTGQPVPQETPMSVVKCPACSNNFQVPPPLISLVNKPTFSMVVIQHVEGMITCPFCNTVMMPIIPPEMLAAMKLVLQPMVREGDIVTPAQAGKPS